MGSKSLKLVIGLFLGLSLLGSDLPNDMKAKFTKIIASSSGATSVLCKDASVASELTKAGVTVGESKFVWASSTAEVKALAASGKLVICGKLDELPQGGSIAIVEEGGKPAIYLHMGNIAKSGVTLGDAILKIGKRL